MELDKKWHWKNRVLDCRVRPETGNPAGDDIRERFAGLAGVTLNDIMTEMKKHQKVKYADDSLKDRLADASLKNILKEEEKIKVHLTGLGEVSMIKIAEDMKEQKQKKEKESGAIDIDAEKKLKEVYHRSFVIGAAAQSLVKMQIEERAEAESKSKKNINKKFLVSLKKPSNRVLMDALRERARPLVLPDSDETAKLAQAKLERRQAKARQARLAEIADAAKSDEDGSHDNVKSALVGHMSTCLHAYGGDKFSSNGDYFEGMLYLSRMNSTGKLEKTKIAHHEEVDLKVTASIAEVAIDNAADNTNPEDAGKTDADRVSVDDLGPKIYCAAALCNWSRNAANAPRLANEGAVRAIMQLSMEIHPRIQVFAACAYRYMSDHLELAKQMIDESSITSIADMASNTSDDFILCNLVIALINLTRVVDKESKLVDDQLPSVLMNIINVKPELGPACCRGIYNLTCVDAPYLFIERLIRCLVSLCVSGSLSIKHICAASICNLSDLKSVRPKCVEEGVISVLSNLARGAELRTRRVCAVILQNISGTKNCRVDMVAKGCVQTIYNLSTDQDPIILRCIGVTLTRLASEVQSCSRIVTDGGTMSLLNIAIKFPNVPGITQPCSAAFRLLSSRPAARELIAKEGSVSAIANLLRASTDIPTLQNSLTALCYLLLDTENHLAIMQQGLITTLSIVSKHDDSSLKEISALAFLNLSMTTESHKHLVGAGGIVSVIELCKHESKITKRRCSAALCNMSSYDVGMFRMVQEGIIPALLGLMTHPDSETVRYTCAALCRLCATQENSETIALSGAVNTLVQGVVEGDQQTQAYCCAVLSSLSYYPSCRSVLCDAGIISALQKLSISAAEETKLRCLIAFGNLSCEKEMHSKLVEQGVVSCISQLSNSYHESDLECCVKALCNLTCCLDAREQLTKQGGVDALMMISMVRSSDVKTKIFCLTAIANMIVDYTMYEPLLKTGAVSLIVRAVTTLSEITVASGTSDSRIPDDRLITLCSQIMNRLSTYDGTKLSIAERTPSLVALFHMYQVGDSETKLLCAHTTSNLILYDLTQQRTLESGALSVLIDGVGLDDHDASLHCMQAVFAICQSDSKFRAYTARSELPMSLARAALNMLFAASASNPASASAFTEAESADTVGTNASVSNSSICFYSTEELLQFRVDKFSYAMKALSLLAWYEESREFLQTVSFLKIITKIINTNDRADIDNPVFTASVQWVAKVLTCVCVEFPQLESVVAGAMASTAQSGRFEASSSIGILEAISILSTFDAVDTVAQSVAAIIRTVCLDSPSCLELFANSATVAVMKSVVSISPIADVLYNLACTLYAYALSTSVEVRASVVVPDVCAVICACAKQSSCWDTIAASISIFVTDPKVRTMLVTPEVAQVIANLLGAGCSQDLEKTALYNTISAVFALSKVPQTRQRLLDVGVELLVVKVQGIFADDESMVANCTRSLKNLSSDSAEAIEEGTVAALIARSLEGKVKKISDQSKPASIDPIDMKPLGPPACISEDVSTVRSAWSVTYTSVLAGDSGKGPAPPKPPQMLESSEGTGSISSKLIEEFDEVPAGTTKMAFAKMQVPQELQRNSHLAEEDFDLREESTDVVPGGVLETDGGQQEGTDEDPEGALVDAWGAGDDVDTSGAGLDTRPGTTRPGTESSNYTEDENEFYPESGSPGATGEDSFFSTGSGRARSPDKPKKVPMSEQAARLGLYS